MISPNYSPSNSLENENIMIALIEFPESTTQLVGAGRLNLICSGLDSNLGFSTPAARLLDLKKRNFMKV